MDVLEVRGLLAHYQITRQSDLSCTFIIKNSLLSCMFL